MAKARLAQIDLPDFGMPDGRPEILPAVSIRRAWPGSASARIRAATTGSSSTPTASTAPTSPT